MPRSLPAFLSSTYRNGVVLSARSRTNGFIVDRMTACNCTTKWVNDLQLCARQPHMTDRLLEGIDTHSVRLKQQRTSAPNIRSQLGNNKQHLVDRELVLLSLDAATYDNFVTSSSITSYCASDFAAATHLAALCSSR